MGCAGCAIKSSGAGCGSAAAGSSCGCSRMSVYNWLSDVPEPSYKTITPVEVSFKNGARKAFFKLEGNRDIFTGDIVVVEAEHGYDMGQISLSGELVKLQMKKRKEKTPIFELKRIIRKANDRDLEKLKEIRELEKTTLIKSRVLARNLGLDMKVGDIEYQGNGRKATFFYTADGRVDFRQLIKDLAGEFKIKVEMRQIGMRQESARVGGIGSCGRELCCSTWLSDFSSVTTSAARYQNLSINQSKLSGQCGRLKCCLNFELDTYLEAYKAFPKKADKIHTEDGIAFLIKTDILKQLMFYKYDKGTTVYKLDAERVKEIVAMNKEGQKPQSLTIIAIPEIVDDIDQDEDLVGHITLDKPKSKRRNNRNKRGRNKSRSSKNKSGQGGNQPKAEQTGGQKKSNRSRNRNRNRNRNKKKGDGDSK